LRVRLYYQGAGCGFAFSADSRAGRDSVAVQKKIFHRFGIKSRAGLTAVWLGKANTGQRSFVIHGQPAKEVSAETLPEQIQLW